MIFNHKLFLKLCIINNMEIEILKRIITDQRNEIEKKFREERIREREDIDYVKKFLKYPNILAILGVRTQL